jgi:class 3 adenylate cyclase
VLAVLDAVGSRSAVLIGYSEGGIPSIALAATQPERVKALVLLSSHDHQDPLPTDSPEVARGIEKMWRLIDATTDSWGEGNLIKAFAPTYAGRPGFDVVAGVNEVRCMSPGMAKSIFASYHGLDVSHLSPAVTAPTLVLQTEDAVCNFAMGRAMAARIPDARFVELEGPDHMVWIHNSQRIPALVEEFVTGARSIGPANRVLSTIVFTDIVGSTQQNALSGDSRWNSVRSSHDQLVMELLLSYDGRPVKSTGDGWLAVFNRTGRAIRFATSLIEGVHDLGLQVRVGIHTGECVDEGRDVHGMAVNIAARITDLAGPDQVLVSSTVKDLVAGSGLEFADEGDYVLKGAPDRWRLHSVVADRPLVTAGGYYADVRRPALGAVG